VPRHSDVSSKELVRVCLASADELAWTEFIRRFHTVIASTVLRTARQWCEPSRAQLDDLIQDTYLKLCENDYRLLRSFQPRQEDSIYGFLKVVATNIVHDHFRSALAVKRGTNLTAAIAEIKTIEPRVPGDSFDAISHRLEIAQIAKVLDEVTAGKDQGRKCAIFWLRHRHGFTASEIAAIPEFGLTTEGVESLLLRLAVMIRSHFAELESSREVKVLKRQNRSKRMGRKF
jgi:RNA polymerase sigma-70 factor (ECF subfamily)